MPKDIKSLSYAIEVSDYSAECNFYNERSSFLLNATGLRLLSNGDSSFISNLSGDYLSLDSTLSNESCEEI